MTALYFGELATQLAGLDKVICLSEGQKFQTWLRAIKLVKDSKLSECQKTEISRTLYRAANPSGFRYIGTGIKEALGWLNKIQTVREKTQGFNLTNLSNWCLTDRFFPLNLQSAVMVNSGK